jgi:hypothetical protein
MKKSFFIIFVILLCFSTNVLSQENETKKEDETFQFQPKPLADNWNKWLIGEWEWSGNAEGAKSITIIEKIDDNKFTLNHKYILPNGKKMEDKTEITRVKTDKKGS